MTEFGCRAGPGGPGTPFKRWGDSPPTFYKGFLGPDHQNRPCQGPARGCFIGFRDYWNPITHPVPQEIPQGPPRPPKPTHKIPARLPSGTQLVVFVGVGPCSFVTSSGHEWGSQDHKRISHSGLSPIGGPCFTGVCEINANRSPMNL